MRVLLKECSEIKNRQNSTLLHKGVLGSLQISQHPAAPKGTTWLRLWEGNVPPPSGRWRVWAPLVTESVPQVQQVPTGWVLRAGPQGCRRALGSSMGLSVCAEGPGLSLC